MNESDAVFLGIIKVAFLGCFVWFIALPVIGFVLYYGGLLLLLAVSTIFNL